MVWLFILLTDVNVNGGRCESHIFFLADVIAIFCEMMLLLTI